MPSQITLPDDTGELTPITDDDHPASQTDSLDPSPPTPGSRAGSRPEPDYVTDKSAQPVFALNLSLSQIVGGGLAAATAAALGSKLGLAGTIGGAALASIVSAVAGSIYTASVRRTHRGVRTALSRHAPKMRPTRPSADEPRAARPLPVERRSIAPRGIVIGALIVFALASVVIFGVERFTGVALDGKYGDTTLGQVSHAGSASLRTARSPKSAGPADQSPAAKSSTKPSSQASTDPSSAPTSRAGAPPSGSSSDPSVSTSQPTNGSTGGTTTGTASSGKPTSGQSPAGQGTTGQASSGRASSGSGTATSGSGQAGSKADAGPGN